jgi:hypothetical protein
MKKMRSTFVVAMLAVAVSASAQLNFGVKGGMTMSNYYGDELSDKNVKIGFNVGLLADFEIGYNSAVQTGLLFLTKGSQYKGSFGSISGEVTVNPMYLQVPVHYAYKIAVTPGTRVVLHAGPYAAYGVGGKSNVKLSISDKSVESKGVDVFGDNGFKPFDAGLGLGVGAELGSFLVDLGWDMGLVNIARSDNATLKNQSAYLSVGFKF